MRRTVFLLVMLGTIFLLANGASLVSTVGLGQLPAAEAQAPVKNAQSEEATGVFHVQYGDPPQRNSKAKAKIEFVLINDEGKENKLRLDEGTARAVGGPRAFDGKRVKVKGNRVSDEEDSLEVQAIDFEQPKDAAEAKARVNTGQPAAQALASEGPTSKPWVTIGCSFSDSPNPDSSKRGYFEDLIGVTYATDPVDGTVTAGMANKVPGIDHYWKEVSFDKMNLDGSQVGDGISNGQKGTKFWYDLSGTQAEYMKTSTSPDLTKIANECTAAADADVYFPDFSGINLVLDQKIGDASWGGTRDFPLDQPPPVPPETQQKTKNYGVTWLPPFAYGHDWVAHEMGHGLGMPHSSGAYTATYDSDWDVMSGSGECDEAYPNGVTTLDGVLIKPDAKYSCISDHTISYHKNLVGWVSSDRKYVAASNSDKTITIERLGQDLSTSTSGYLMAQIPIKGSTTQFYTVEARRLAGYDNHASGRIPGDAIVIHKVNTTLSDRDAQVVDSTTRDKNPNDAGAMWLKDEIFSDSKNGITIKVTGTTSSGYSVQIKRTR